MALTIGQILRASAPAVFQYKNLVLSDQIILEGDKCIMWVTDCNTKNKCIISWTTHDEDLSEEDKIKFAATLLDNAIDVIKFTNETPTY
jgi:hypothetical protein